MSTHTQMLLSTKQVAEALDVSRRTIYRMRQTGKLPKPVKMGKSLKWRREELEAWVAAGCPPLSRWEWEGGE